MNSQGAAAIGCEWATLLAVKAMVTQERLELEIKRLSHGMSHGVSSEMSHQGRGAA
jgi:hypothetical protein